MVKLTFSNNKKWFVVKSKMMGENKDLAAQLVQRVLNVVKRYIPVISPKYYSPFISIFKNHEFFCFCLDKFLFYALTI